MMETPFEQPNNLPDAYQLPKAAIHFRAVVLTWFDI